MDQHSHQTRSREMTKPACKNCALWTINYYVDFITDERGYNQYKKKGSGEVISYEEFIVLPVYLRKEYRPYTKPAPGKSYMDKEGVHGKWGLCEGIPFVHNIGFDGKNNKEIPNAVCNDGSSYSASVETSENFFCANFQQRNEP